MRPEGAAPAVTPAPPPFVAAPAPPGGPGAGAAPPRSRAPQFPRPKLPRKRRRPRRCGRHRAASEETWGGRRRPSPAGKGHPQYGPGPARGAEPPPPHPRLLRAPRTAVMGERAGTSRSSSAPQGKKKKQPPKSPQRPKAACQGVAGRRAGPVPAAGAVPVAAERAGRHRLLRRLPRPRPPGSLRTCAAARTRRGSPSPIPIPVPSGTPAPQGPAGQLPSAPDLRRGCARGFAASLERPCVFFTARSSVLSYKGFFLPIFVFSRWL